MNHRFYIRLIVALLILTAVFFALFKIESWRVINRQKNALEVQVHDVDRQLSQFAVLSKLLSSDPRLVDVLRNENAISVATANELLLRTVAVSDATFAFVMDAEGTTRAASNYAAEVSFIGKNYAFRPYFTGAIRGEETTFFAVGATTGVPGYFTASPVLVAGVVAGVVVVKIESAELPTLWRERGGSALVTDEFGVVLLATESAYLYTPSKPIEPAEQVAISEQRRYSVAEEQVFKRSDADRWQLQRSSGGTQKFVSVSQPLNAEPWHLSLIQPLTQIYWRTLQYFLSVLALVVIGGLLWRIFRQQRQLASVHEREARELERLVGERTRELENTQQALIAESNFTMLGKMSAAINHEVNQPLASLRLNLASLRGILESRGASPDDIHEVVVDCDRTTKRISRVIETLALCGQKTSTGIRSLHVNQLITDVETTVRRERPQMSRSLSVRRDPLNSSFQVTKY